MSKHLNVVVVGLLMLGITATASACPWYHGCPWWYYNTTPVNYSDIQKRAEDMLNGANTLAVKNWWGYEVYFIVKNGVVEGVLWDNVNLNDVKVGQPYFTPWFAKVPLIYDGKIVGMLNVPIYT